MIPILFEDGEALVVDKPAGLPIERPRAGGPSLEDHLAELRLGFQREPVAVHRLDTDTSGCLLLARNPKAAVRFGLKFNPVASIPVQEDWERAGQRVLSQDELATLWNLLPEQLSLITAELLKFLIASGGQRPEQVVAARRSSCSITTSTPGNGA